MLSCLVLQPFYDEREEGQRFVCWRKVALTNLLGNKKVAQAHEAVKSSLCDSPRRYGLTEVEALDQLVLRSFTELSALA